MENTHVSERVGISTIIVGYVNIHLNAADDLDTHPFTRVLDVCGIQQHVYEPTNVHGHTLDVVIIVSIVSDVEVKDPALCVHLDKLSRGHFEVSFRKLRSIDVETFKRDITTSTILYPFNGSVDELANAYNNGLHSLIDQHAPLCSK